MTKSKISDIIYSESERRTKSPQYGGEGVGSQMRLITSFTLFDSASATIVLVIDYQNITHPTPVRSLGVERKRLAFEAENEREEHDI